MAVQTVIAAGTMTRAAEVLCISQPAVSNLVSTLERELGFKLFERRGSSVVPTREAIQFNDEAHGVLLSLDRLKDVASNIRTRNQGTLRIGVQSSIGAAFLAPAVSAFRRERHNVRIQLSVLRGKEIELSLLSSSIDMAVVEAPFEHGLIDCRECSLDYVCVLPRSHRLNAQRVVTPAMLDGMPFVALPETSLATRAASTVFREHGARFNCVILADSFVSICSLVSQGAGIGLVDSMTAEQQKSQGHMVRPFAPGISFRVGLLRRNDRPLSGVARDFISVCLGHLNGRLGVASHRQPAELV